MRIFFSRLVGDSHQVRTVKADGFLDFNAHIALQVNMNQIVAASKSGDFETLNEYVFSTFAKFLRALRRQINQ